MAKRQALPGWERIPGSARRFRNTATGQEISRRAMQTMLHGGVSPEEVAVIRRVTSGNKAPRSRYSALVSAFKRAQSKILGIPMRAVKVRGQSDQALEFRNLYKELAAEGRKKVQDNSPTGRKAEILVMLGLRERDATYPVGQSPTTQTV